MFELDTHTEEGALGFLNGFHMTFANGWTVSVQFGKYNYSSARDELMEGSKVGETATAECAFYSKSSGLVQREGWEDTVKGWMSADEALELMTYVASLPPGTGDDKP